MENLETGLLLMMVGMLTVFAILLIVIGIGKGLIRLVNRYAPEEVIKKVVISHTGVSSGIADQSVAAIVSAVSTVTGGKGKVTSIEKK